MDAAFGQTGNFKFNSIQNYKPWVKKNISIVKFYYIQKRNKILKSEQSLQLKFRWN